MNNWLPRTAMIRALALLAVFLGATLLVAFPGSEPVATLTSPANGTASVAQPVTFQWTTVPGVEFYYLYVGTTQGAKDVVDTGGLIQTSWTATAMPTNATLYARLWTKTIGGPWAYVDSTFTTSNVAPPPILSHLTYPVNNAPSVALPVTFQWTTVPSVEYYYLYVGTTVGAKNVVDTGGLHQTSWTATGLPNATTLYARLWTKTTDAPWRYVDSVFTTAPSLVANLTYPANNATSVGLPVTFQWTTVPAVESYYLYVGTTVGAKNVVDTGGILQTFWTTTSLPSGATLYARLWTKAGGVWRYLDSTFTTQNLAPPPVVANLTYPLNDASSVGVPTTFQWTSVPGVEFYYLYVGTRPGALDVVDSKGLLQTSYTTNLPGNITLYTRLWTKVGGIWRFVDTKFGTQTVTARLGYPVTGLTVSTDVTFRWNGIAGAQGYTLDIGTSAGASDVLQMPEQTATSAPLTNLPQGQLLYARLGTHHGGVWRYSDSTFSTLVTKAVLTAPVNAETGVTIPKVFQWTPVEDAQAYRLQVGSSTGSQNILDSGETTQTQWTVPLPDSSALHARLWTKFEDTWRYIDSTFSTVALRARFIHPVVGAVGVNPGQAFQWAPVAAADGYTLQIGSTWGASDLLDTGELQSTAYLPENLPADQTLYARIWTRIGSVSRYDDTIFTLESSVAPSSIIQPADGASAFGTGVPFRWTKVDMASGYRLLIGTAPGESDLHNSGDLFVTRRFVRNLPVGQTLYGQVQTHIGTDWVSTPFTFTVASTDQFEAATIGTARWATAEVRQMADGMDQAMAWSPLGLALNPIQLGVATAGDFTQTLLTALSQVNGGAQSRRLDVGFTPGTTETHVLVEFQRPDTNVWMLLDPMFGLTVNRTIDGESATAAEVKAATGAQAWSDVTYEPLTSGSSAFATGYYIDYPLFYLNVFAGGAWPPGSPSPELYMTEVSTPVATPGIYIIGCDGLPQVSAIIDGQTVTVACPGPDTTSGAIFASTIAVPPGGSFRVFTLRRFVFTN